MASGLCAALTGRTHGCTDQPASVKKTLANSEPSTHGTSRTSRDVRPESAKRAKADIDQVAVTNRDFMSESERDDSAGPGAKPSRPPPTRHGHRRAEIDNRIRPW